MKYQHGEAFNHMAYRCVNGHDETIWNSRDGVTPFVMDCRVCGADSQHIEWHCDVRAEAYQPKVGDRIFVNVTPTEALEFAKVRMQQYEEAGYKWQEAYDGFTFDQAVGFLAAGEFYRDGQAPNAIIVTREWLDTEATNKAEMERVLAEINGKAAER